MKPIGFEDVNAVLEGGNIESLPVHRGNGFTLSRWRPSLRERLSMLSFGSVWVAILSDIHPPIAIAGGRGACFEIPRAEAVADG